MPRRAATTGFAVSLAAALTLLAGCADQDPFQTNERAARAPITSKLTMSDATGSDCPIVGGKNYYELGDDVMVAGEGFAPGTLVTLRWTVLQDNNTGVFKTVTAAENGGISEKVKLDRAVGEVGQTVEITAEGESPDGLLVLGSSVRLQKC